MSTVKLFFARMRNTGEATLPKADFPILENFTVFSMEKLASNICWMMDSYSFASKRGCSPQPWLSIFETMAPTFSASFLEVLGEDMIEVCSFILKRGLA